MEINLKQIYNLDVFCVVDVKVKTNVVIFTGCLVWGSLATLSNIDIFHILHQRIVFRTAPPVNKLLSHWAPQCSLPWSTCVARPPSHLRVDEKYQNLSFFIYIQYLQYMVTYEQLSMHNCTLLGYSIFIQESEYRGQYTYTIYLELLRLALL